MVLGSYLILSVAKKEREVRPPHSHKSLLKKINGFNFGYSISSIVFAVCANAIHQEGVQVVYIIP